MNNEQVIPEPDARERLRVKYTADVYLETQDHRTSKGQLRDIGLNSLYLIADTQDVDTLISGEEVNVKVTLQADGSSLTIELDGSIGRMDEAGFVIQFSNPLRWWPIFVMFPDLSEE